ncbi:DNA repair protein RecO [Magnetospirillum sp. UT-4]|uniref:DNA repair protein RecO n=1 Tax=Magnetospirillum sp. UT-4 TaxID=2681467 RepID=UPI00138097CC|nr:DNA repair protein RecO [Magnetospirillum sp. UT-4]CAA7618057.1 DNA repair protein RecO [Magnetospirillum sp. UT-4]
MEWADEGIVLAVRRHGENGAVASLLTRAHGRHPGLVHGGSGKANRGVLQPGNHVKAWWRGRLAEQLGSYRVEMAQAHAAGILDHAGRLAAVASACALCEAVLPEREPHPAAFAALVALLEAMKSEAWPSVYVHWELALLRDLGYGLDLTACAATGATIDLGYVSPKTGRAVSRAAAEPYRDRLLPLPAFLVEGGEGSGGDILDGLALTGYFLDRHVLAPHRVAMPAARSRLIDRLRG